MAKVTKWLIVGRFGRPHGIKGLIRVLSFTEPGANILNYQDWHVYIDKKWQPIELLHTELRHKLILVEVAGYTEREQVADLTNIDIAIDYAQLPPLAPGEYYWHQLIGLRVVNLQGEALGTVKEIMPTGSNDVLVVEGTKRYLIPYLPGRFISHIDPSQQLITVDWDADS